MNGNICARIHEQLTTIDASRSATFQMSLSVFRAEKEWGDLAGKTSVESPPQVHSARRKQNIHPLPNTAWQPKTPIT